jgi:trimeric autotransporter adhesin
MRKIYFTTLVLFLSCKEIYSQINIQSSTNGSVSILPNGLKGNYQSSNTNPSNIAIGDSAAQSLSASTINTIAIGKNALMSQSFNNPSGSFNLSNIAIGTNSLSKNQSSQTLNGNYNTSIGHFSMENNTTGDVNTAVGYGSLRKNTTGRLNTAIGQNALNNNTTGERNIAIGVSSLISNKIGSYNTAIGFGALLSNKRGNENIAIGLRSFYKDTTGSYNISIGDSSLFNNFARNNNIAVGIKALYSNSIGSTNTNESSYNIALGNNSLQNNTLGHSNIGLGYYTLWKNIDGSQNIAIGMQTLQNHQTGWGNIGIGSFALGTHQTGDYNIAIGRSALKTNATGSNNLALGYFALDDALGSGNIGIGYMAGKTETGSNKLYIENSASTSPLIGGDFAVDRVGINRAITDISATAYTLQVGGDASKDVAGSWASHSDKRLKKNIQQLNSEAILNKILQLKGVTYEWDDQITHTIRPNGLQYGFIAQNIQEVFPTKVKQDTNGYLMTAYGDYDPMIIEAIRALNDKIERLEKENTVLKNLVANTSNVLNINKKKSKK